MSLTLTRELRFGLYPSGPGLPAVPQNSANAFAANPVLLGIAPFLVLQATVTGTVDGDTGMLINIKIVDQVLRQHAVPFLQDRASGPRGAGGATIETLLPPLLQMLAPKFSPHTLAALTLFPSPYLSFSIDSKESAMIKTSLRFEFSAAHRLHSPTLSEKQNQDVFGRCNNPNGHGHNYELEVTLAGTPDSTRGEMLPGGILQLQAIVNQTILDHFDHKHLNLDCPEFQSAAGAPGLNPTVENIARVIYRKLKPAIPGPAILHSVRLWETPKTMAEYSE